MKNRHVLRIILVLAVLVCVPTASFSSENKLSPEEASKAVSELVQSVGPKYECRIFGIGIWEVHSSSGESADYHVSFEAFGQRCDEARKVLNHRGKSKGLWFFKRPKPNRIDKVPDKPKLDLINEIDPPVDT